MIIRVLSAFRVCEYRAFTSMRSTGIDEEELTRFWMWCHVFTSLLISHPRFNLSSDFYTRSKVVLFFKHNRRTRNMIGPIGRLRPCRRAQRISSSKSAPNIEASLKYAQPFPHHIKQSWNNYRKDAFLGSSPMLYPDERRHPTSAPPVQLSKEMDKLTNVSTAVCIHSSNVLRCLYMVPFSATDSDQLWLRITICF